MKRRVKIVSLALAVSLAAVLACALAAANQNRR